ncbi:hypothetical protein F66182_10078 [Fusarium sp. NRRL 66182]|nr:hypothetical protein F66182_10078 [Fusarium sp. NRRL 66182]
MLSSHSSGVMPHNAPELLHRQAQAPQPRVSIAQYNGAPAGFPAVRLNTVYRPNAAFIPINTQSYDPPAPPTHAVRRDLRRPDPVEISEIQGGVPQTYRVMRLEKTPSASKVDSKPRDSASAWEKVIRTEKHMPQSMIRDKIHGLQKKRSVSKKKQDKNDTIQRQLDKAEADLTSWDPDRRFCYKLVQLESEWRTAGDRSEQTSRRYRGHSRRSKSPKMERTAVIAYFKRAPAVGQQELRLSEAESKMRQMQHARQPHVQPSSAGLSPVVLNQELTHCTHAAIPKSTQPVLDLRLNGQPKPAARQQTTHFAAQAQPPRQGAFNTAQPSGRTSVKQDHAMPRVADTPRSGQGELPDQSPPRLPAIRLPTAPPPVKGPVLVPRAPTPMPTEEAGNLAKPPKPSASVLQSQAVSGPQAGASRTGHSAPRKIVVETNPNARDSINVYHVSDRSSSTSDDGWSEDESEDTRPSSISSDHNPPQRGRGRSPAPKHKDHGNVIIQEPRHTRRDVENFSNERVSMLPFRPHVRFDSPGHRYREESRSPRRGSYPQHRPEGSWRRVEASRIIQNKSGVRHVSASTARREVFAERLSRNEKPLERARMDDNDRFEHFEKEIRRRRELKERHQREYGHRYADSDSRWSDEEAREYMRQKEISDGPSLRSFRHQERR